MAAVLNKIDSPADLKALAQSELEQLAAVRVLLARLVGLLVKQLSNRLSELV